MFSGNFSAIKENRFHMSYSLMLIKDLDNIEFTKVCLKYFQAMAYILNELRKVGGCVDIFAHELSETKLFLSNSEIVL